MPKQELAQANPPPDKSQLPADVLKLKVELDISNVLSDEELHALEKFTRAAEYIAASMIYLRSNTLLTEPLDKSHIKPRLLGHWGTCPGLILVYAHVNRIIRTQDLDALLVVGPGHGAPAILSCLWLEDSISPFYPKYTRDKKGLANLISGFSTPGGFPSHINAETPGSIHEGGELGYALAVAFGAVMDNPDLIAVCVVGDGEAETGPTATSWHGYKYIDPAESGAVLPIVHVNGFKISERTIYGTMDDAELVALFSGYGYHVRFVEDLPSIHSDLAASVAWAVGVIRNIQNKARNGTPEVKPRWPVLILRTPKGWSGPRVFKGDYIEGSFKSHQVPLSSPNENDEQLDVLKSWLESYDIHELINTESGVPIEQLLSIVPDKVNKKLGMRREAYDAHEPLALPEWKDYVVEKGTQQSAMKTTGEFLHDVIKKNPKSFRIFSPDELESNKLDAVLRDSGRNFQWDVASRAKGGRIIEVLSEHMCQGMLQGYTLTGRTGMFPSYEAFLGIIATMAVQYSKFNKMARETKWHGSVGSINYVETSTWARQEHNGFSHQNPSFVSILLNLKPEWTRIYLPPDANCFLSTISHCLRNENYVNLLIGSKQPTPVWLTPEEANQHCIAGASIWKFASTDDGVDPDAVIVGVGVEVTFEVVAAAALLRKLIPALRVRVVNVTDLMILGPERTHPHALTDPDFRSLFTADRSIHFNFHGYPIQLKGLLFGREGLDRVTVEGYREEGTTTSPFDMMLANHTSRYHVAIAAIRGGARVNSRVAVDAHAKIAYLLHLAEKDKQYIYAHGKDTPEAFDTPQFD